MDNHPGFNYNEGRRICIVTNTGIDKAPEPLKPIIHLLSSGKEPMNDPFYQRIRASVEEIKKNPDVRRAAMLLAERDAAIREEGKEEGKEEGREEERKNSVEKMLDLCREMQMSEDEILAKLLSLYPENTDLVREAVSSLLNT